MQSRPHFGLCVLTLLSVAFCAPGCQANGQQKKGPWSVTPKIDLPAKPNLELEKELKEVTAFAEAEVSRVTQSIEKESDDRRIRRAALVWKLKILGEMHEDLTTKEPPVMLVDSWGLWLRVQRYLQAGEGKDIFGQWQTDAIQAASEIVSRLEGLTQKHIPEKQWSQVRQEIDSYAKNYPITGVFEHAQAQDFAAGREGRDFFDRVFGIPLVAVNRVGESLDPTSRLARSVDRFREVANDYPQMVRWQLELLMLDLEQLSTVQSAIESLTQTAEAAARFSETAEQLPVNLRTEAQALLDDVDSRQPQLRETLQETRAVIDGANQAMTKVDDVTKRLGELNSQLTESGNAWSETAIAVKAAVEQIQQFGRKSSDKKTAASTQADAAAHATDASEPERRPFDIRDYTQTANSLRDATIELRLLLDELNTLAEGEGIARSKAEAGALAGEVLTDTQSRMRDVVDHAFWRAVQLALVVAALTAVYQLLSHRMRAA